MFVWISGPLGAFWGQNRGRAGEILTPNEHILTFGGYYPFAKILVKIDQEMRR